MTDQLQGIPDRWFFNLKGIIVVLCSGENVGVNASLDLRDDLTDDQKIGIISQIANTLNLQYDILRGHMDVKVRGFKDVVENMEEYY